MTKLIPEDPTPHSGTLANADTNAAGPTAAAVASMLPAELLQPGEIIVLLLKPSLWFIVLGCLRDLAIIAVAAMALHFAAGFPWVPLHRSDVMLLSFGLVAVRLFWQFLEWLSRVYVLTDRRVVRVKGVIRVEVFEASLKQVQHTQSLFLLRERLFGLGTITFATAGTGIDEVHWVMINRPLEIHQVVVQTLNRYR
jgi:uncharacterized membrane protein YdbT with pleckstrin-like domain